MQDQKLGTIDKVIRPGSIPNTGGFPKRLDVFCRIKYDGKRLSISGVEGPKPNGDAWGSCGQIEMHYKHRNPADDDARSAGYAIGPEDFSWALGWDAERWLGFLDVWHRWHLNDMRAECEHQRERGEKYDNNPDAVCPDCDYKIGSAWLVEEVDEAALMLLEMLPKADKEPNWV